MYLMMRNYKEIKLNLQWGIFYKLTMKIVTTQAGIRGSTCYVAPSRKVTDLLCLCCLKKICRLDFNGFLPLAALH